MKPVHTLLAFVLTAGLAGCNPAPDTRSPSSDRRLEERAEMPEAAPPPQDAPVAVEPEPWALTTFEPTTVEIYCSFFHLSDEGVRGDRLFITEIAGIPAPAAIGLEGQSVPMTEVSKEKGELAETWTYRNDERGVEVALKLTGTEEGGEYRNYQGTIQVIAPEKGMALPISGSCGV